MRKLFILIFLLSFIPFYGWEWTTKGYTMISTTNVDEKTHLQINDSLNRSFSISYSGELSEKMQDRVVAYFKEFQGWNSLKIREIRFDIEEGILKIVVLPESLKLEGNDISSFIPAGIFLAFDQDMVYDFRMMKGAVFMRIKGLYINETELLKKMDQALKNPDAYIKRNDPDYILAKLEELDQSVEVLQLDNYRLKIALMSLQNRGLFGKVYPVDQQLLKKVVEIRKEAPNLTRPELEKRLLSQGQKFSKRELYLIFAVVYNEFD